MRKTEKSIAMSILFRPVERKDLADIIILAQHSGVGMTTLPADKSALQQRIEHSLQSLAKDINTPQSENYLFVLEDAANKQIVGVAGIDAVAGGDIPFYSYKLSKVTRVCHQLGIRNEYQILNLVNDYQGKTELCSLFLHPDYRRHNNGYFLSVARLLFMAVFKQRFTDLVIADMRGVSNKQGESPFWNSLAKRFFLMDYQQADYLTVTTNKQFIADLMPHNSIYVALLTKRAQEVIARPHNATKPAVNILKKEGFQHQGYIDIFDAGPTLEAPLTQINTIKNSTLHKLIRVEKQLPVTPRLLSNCQLDFRATVAPVQLEKGGCVLASDIAKLLKLKLGDKVCIAPV